MAPSRPRRNILRAPKTDFGSLLSKKSGFLASVYATLAVQLVITALVSAYLRKRPDIYAKVRPWWPLWFVLSIGVILLLSLVSLPLVIQIPLVVVFSILLGITLLASDKRIPPELIRAALLSTATIFVVMTAVAFILAAAGINLAFMGFVLFMILLALVITYIVLLFVPVQKTTLKVILTIGMVLFTIYIAFDTNIILQGEYGGNFIAAAMSLYLDTVNLFGQTLGFMSSD